MWPDARDDSSGQRVYPNLGTMTTTASSPLPLVITTRRAWMLIVTGGIPSPFRPPVSAGGHRIWLLKSGFRLKRKRERGVHLGIGSINQFVVPVPFSP